MHPHSKLESMAATCTRFYIEGQIHIEKASVQAHGCGHYLTVVSQKE